MAGWTVYILRCSDASLYTGIAADLERRLAAHRRGVASKYTRARLPVRLVYAEPRADRSDASRREAEIKRLRRSEKLALIRSRPSRRRRLGGARATALSLAILCASLVEVARADEPAPSANAVRPIDIGEKAPLVGLRDVDGRTAELDTWLGRGLVALVFYRGGW